jgi:predicted nucleic acid-binding protein
MWQMPDLKQTIVTNTTPLIALAAGLGSLDILRALYNRVMVPWEVNEEIHAAGQDAPGVLAFDQASWLDCQSEPVAIAPYLRNTLDRGEASVIQTALDLNIPLVCIDESVGRRVARLSGLTLTGSIGILIKARRQGYPVSIPDVIKRMREHGIWLSDEVVRFALAQQD